MGGGDLNSKKSWHPNTMKNQERVWKAEQAAAEEKKRMRELQRERAEERDRDELNSIMNKNNSASGSDHRLAWMYDKPDKKVEQEEYLLGKALNKNADQLQDVAQDPIPAVSRRVVGSSMLTAGGDVQVDISRKIREDPLILIKERERAARAALLNNPLQRRKLTELLRKEQNKKKSNKVKKKSKEKDKDLDDLLAAKLNALGGQKGIDLATLLDSDDSSEEEKSKSKKKKREKHKTDKQKKHKHNSDSESDKCSHGKSHDRDKHKNNKRDKDIKEYQSNKYNNKHSREHSSIGSREFPFGLKEYREDNSHNKWNYYEASQRNMSTKSMHDNKKESYKSNSNKRLPSEDDKQKRDLDNRDSKRRGLSDAEKAARLAEMAAAGVEREVERGKRVVAQHAADQATANISRIGPSRHEARALPDSLESRIRSNRHYIQRDKRHMNENFARR